MLTNKGRAFLAAIDADKILDELPERKFEMDGTINPTLYCQIVDFVREQIPLKRCKQIAKAINKTEDFPKNDGKGIAFMLGLGMIERVCGKTSAERVARLTPQNAPQQQ